MIAFTATFRPADGHSAARLLGSPCFDEGDAGATPGRTHEPAAGGRIRGHEPAAGTVTVPQSASGLSAGGFPPTVDGSARAGSKLSHRAGSSPISNTRDTPRVCPALRNPSVCKSRPLSTGGVPAMSAPCHRCVTVRAGSGRRRER
ncbi:hypothetical protein GCM10022419_013960 [Nonomuraea rosea]|uniref:Uncharacterized protein n=1 Tax=Nonomuraea rosea TaxID=638574 RepID=A0ABP6VK35_9ACTN